MRKTGKNEHILRGLLAIAVGPDRLREIDAFASVRDWQRSRYVRFLIDQSLERERVALRLEASAGSDL